MDTKRVSDNWERGSAYEQYVGRWSRQVAPRFLAWLAVPPGRRWLDIGCGTGALTAAIADGADPASVIGVDPSAEFLATATRNVAGRAGFQQGSATAIPLDNASVDVVVSGLALNFVPEPLVALREMQRVTVANGILAGYVWDYAGKMELMRIFWDAAVELDPGAENLDEGRRFPLCNPQSLSQLFDSAGLLDIEVLAIDLPTPFADFNEYWQPFLGGQGPAPSYVMTLDASARERLRERLHERLAAVSESGSFTLTARAWAVRARVPDRP